jgi:aryl-alcohol dehydrogenase-like predicted oxidoreductase
MRYRKLGQSGLEVSIVGLGTNNFGRRLDDKATAIVVDQALEIGVNFIDTANMYGGGLSEEYIGKALKGKRNQALLATKVSARMGQGANQSGNSRQHIMEQVEISLKRLNADHIDLYQIHFPDPRTPIEETLRALDDLVHQGKVRYLGCSNFSSWQVCEALWTSKAGRLESFVSVQPEWNMLNREVENELVPFCRTYGVGIIPYFPLASGFLTGKYRPDAAVPEGTRFYGDTRRQERTLTKENFSLLVSLEEFAKQRGHSMVELAIAWLLASPQVSSVIAGATSGEQVVANAAACDWDLSSEEIQLVDKLLTGEQ